MTWVQGLMSHFWRFLKEWLIPWLPVFLLNMAFLDLPLLQSLEGFWWREVYYPRVQQTQPQFIIRSFCQCRINSGKWSCLCICPRNSTLSFTIHWLFSYFGEHSKSFFIVQFVSRTVITAYITAASFLILVNQARHVLGITGSK